MFVEIINYTNNIETLAKSCDTISNEILTSISNRVKRIYLNFNDFNKSKNNSKSFQFVFQ